MGTNSEIEWTDHTLNFWMGCTKLSPACANCYMYRDAKRYGRDPTVVTRTSPATWRQPLVKSRATGKYKWQPGEKVFVCSWSDFFHEDADDWRHEAFQLMEARRDLVWMILTKRPEEAFDALSNYGPNVIKTIIPNLYLGVTVEKQHYDWRIDELLKLRDYAKVLFVSAEPLLGELDLHQYVGRFCGCGIPGDACDAWKAGRCDYEPPRLDLVITGSETGPGKRPTDQKWFRQLRDDCQAAGVPFFFKKNNNGSPYLDGVKYEEEPE